MATITICSDFGAPKIKSATVSTVSPSICHLKLAVSFLGQILEIYLVAQVVKNLPAMQEMWVRSLHWEDPLEKGKAIHSSILAWRTPWTVLCISPWGCKESDVTEQLSLSSKIKVVPFPHH